MPDEKRLQALGNAIQRDPDAPVNYLLRGEYWFEVGDTDNARHDFLQARDLAQAALEESDWGYVLQSYLDRAERWLYQLENE